MRRQSGMNFCCTIGRSEKRIKHLRSAVVTSPPVLVTIVPGFGSRKDLGMRIKNWLVAIWIPIARPRRAVVLKQPLVGARNDAWIAAGFADHHFPHRINRVGIWVQRPCLNHPRTILFEWRL